MKEISLFQCLANPTRLAVLQTLARHGARCVADLVEATGAEQTNLSHHLAQLRACGLVATRPDGKRVVYRIAHPGLAALLEDVTRLADHIACTDETACVAAGCCP